MFITLYNARLTLTDLIIKALQSASLSGYSTEYENNILNYRTQPSLPEMPDYDTQERPRFRWREAELRCAWWAQVETGLSGQPADRPRSMASIQTSSVPVA